MTFLKKFEAIQKKYAKADLTKLTEDFAIQVNLTDEDCCGAFYIAYINDEFAVEPYDYHDHTAMITTDAKTFDGFIGGKKDIADMTVEGNEEHVKAIALILEKKKAAAKKPAAKKTTATKAASKKAEEVKVDKEVKAVEEVKTEEKKAEAANAPAKKAPAKKPAAKKTTKKAEDK